jgi:hypothetical protein
VVGLSACSMGAWYTLYELQLPVPKLSQVCKLALTKVRVSSSSSSSAYSTRTAVTLPRLQALTLRECNITVQLLSQLLNATTLSRLHWSYTEPRLFSSDFWCKQLTNADAYGAMWQLLQLLPGLTELMLDVGRLTPDDIAPLKHLQQLRHLHLDSRWSADAAGSGPRELLAALQHLTRLRHLHLRTMGAHMVRPQAPQHGSYQRFSALTASTQLT